MTDRALVSATVEHSLEVDASPESVFALWTTSAGLSSWWGASAEVDPRPGGVIRVCLASGPVMSGEYVVVDPPNRIVFTFGWETPPPDGALPPGSTTVHVTISRRPGGSVLTLRHGGLPVEHIGNHARGWMHFLGELAGVARADRG